MPRPTATEKDDDEEGVPGQIAGTTAVAASSVYRWVGSGAQDACGAAWQMDVILDGDQLTGTLVRGKAEYQMYGTLNAHRTLVDGHAGKAKRSNGIAGPRFLTFSLALTAKAAKGEFSIDGNGGTHCRTAVTLTKV